MLKYRKRLRKLFMAFLSCTMFNRKKLNEISFLVISIGFGFSCKDKSGDKQHQYVITDSIKPVKDSLQKMDSTGSTAWYKEMLIPRSDSFDGYSFDFGYRYYDEEKYGFSNPGFFEVRKSGKLVFSDTFKGEGEVFVKSLGRHRLNGEKLVFTLSYGTQACDYVHHSRFYVIYPNGDIKFIEEYYNISGGDGYATRGFFEIFPEDSTGTENTIKIVEGFWFHEKDQPDLFDTNYISFQGKGVKIVKPTDNLSQAK